MKRAAPEVEIARPVVAYFRDLGWDVHQEVALHGGGSQRADIVARLGDGARSRLHVVEVKSAFTVDVVAQALAWIPYAHHVSVAVPEANGRARWLLERFCRSEGIGVLEVQRRASYGEPDACRVEPRVAPEFRRTMSRTSTLAQLRRLLCDETRTTGEAGNATQHYHTPFRRTCDGIRYALRDGPLTTAELVSRVEHHYRKDASARSSLNVWLGMGKVRGVVRVPDSSPFQWTLADGA